MNKENLSWWLSFLFSGLVSYCLWLWMSPGWNPEYLFPGTLFAVMLSFTGVFGATLHMQRYSDRFIAPRVSGARCSVFSAICCLCMGAGNGILFTGLSRYSLYEHH
ncbi:hypothetical protein MU985_004847 [Salmonella enterica]|nr:hypothetical protein [Salmonella enterica]EHK4291647.1 hypothetical protein [Salmonella enterica]EHK4307231.1 hypothetical protein [Salmonella enterica]EJA5030492.1 hypothetical protein [Salmonella enterica]EJA5054329.1 hypothetical protein [Salmonella enterica]